MIQDLLFFKQVILCPEMVFSSFLAYSGLVYGDKCYSFNLLSRPLQNYLLQTAKTI